MVISSRFETMVNCEASRLLYETYNDCPELEVRLRAIGGAPVAFAAVRRLVTKDMLDFHEELEAFGLAVHFDVK